MAFSRPPEPGNFAKKTATARRHVQEKIDAGEIPRSKDFKSVWSRFKQHFEDAQHCKCGYCERNTTASSWGAVEHYAPKAQIDALLPVAPAPETEYQRRRKVSELGYHCRAYDWTNYLFACERCNTHKGNLFPLAEPQEPRRPCAGHHESPLLLHPYEDALRPEEHLQYDIDTGAISGKTERGRATIRTCRLDRPALTEARMETAAKVRGIIEKFLSAVNADEPHNYRARLLELREYGYAARRFSGMVRIIVRKETGSSWEQLMTLLPSDQRPVHQPPHAHES